MTLTPALLLFSIISYPIKILVDFSGIRTEIVKGNRHDHYGQNYYKTVLPFLEVNFQVNF